MNTCVIRNLKGNKYQIEYYFDAVKQRFNNMQHATGYAPDPIVLNIAGKLVEIAFGSEAIEKKLMPSLAVHRATGTTSNAGCLYCWQDSPDNYCLHIPTDAFFQEVWQHTSQWANVFVPSNKRYYRGWHFARNDFFYCQNETYPLDIAHTTHPFRQHLHPWALSQGLLFVHGAAVEIGGCGIFLGSTGGKGKSTLAISCLMADHGFAGDDYVLLDQNGAAHMVYGTGYLKPDILEKLPALYRSIIVQDSARNNKTLLDLTCYAQNFKSPIPLQMVIAPHIGHSTKPILRKVPPARYLWEVVRSSAEQNGAKADQSFMSAIFNRLASLPVYEFCLTSDVNRNLSALEDFITRWKKNVSFE